jgi:hypothetical protein
MTNMSVLLFFSLIISMFFNRKNPKISPHFVLCLLINFRKMTLYTNVYVVDQFLRHIIMVVESTNRRNVKTRQQHLV